MLITAGSFIVNSVYSPSSLSTVSSPPCDLTICRAKYKPSPVPIFLNFFAAEKYLLKILSMSSLEIPAPKSLTLITMNFGISPIEMFTGDAEKTAWKRQ